MAKVKTAANSSEGSDPKKSVQLIVFSPVNADPSDEDHRIYMVCPASLRVVEVVEKFDDEAMEYVDLLGRKKVKKELDSTSIESDLTTEFAGEIEVTDTNDFSTTVKEKLDDNEDAATLSDEQDVEITTFASESLIDIFPDDGDTGQKDDGVSDLDLAEAFALLDEEDNEEDTAHFEDFLDQESESVPEL